MYKCTNCQDEITDVVVHCAKCDNINLCVECFASGAEIGQHRNNHPYQLRDINGSTIFLNSDKKAWSVRDQVLLLNATDYCGFGNWDEISKRVEARSAEEVKNQYIETFVEGTIGRLTWSAAKQEPLKIIDHTEDENPGTSEQWPTCDITPEEAAQIGYTPNIDKFECEYDPNAEKLIAKKSLETDDTELDTMLKLAFVEMYERRLRERHRRKRIVRDYQLVAKFARNSEAQPARMTKHEKLRERFRVFAQLHKPNEHECLLDSLLREDTLRKRLAELHRSIGNNSN